jgi:hypothetical protein
MWKQEFLDHAATAFEQGKHRREAIKDLRIPLGDRKKQRAKTKKESEWLRDKLPQ